MVLALDDLHWADPASIDLVCRILHRGIVHPSLLLLALRPGQAETRLRTALWEAERHGLVTWVELQPLSTTESNELLKGVGDRALRKLIYRESGGNPLYLEQLAAAGARQARAGHRRRAARSASRPRSAPRSAPRPRRSRRPRARCSKAPRSPAIRSTRRSPPRPPACRTADALTALDELVDSGLIRPTDAPRRFRFRHPIVRHAVYQGAGAGWRLGSHGRVAAALERAGTRPPRAPRTSSARPSRATRTRSTS